MSFVRMRDNLIAHFNQITKDVDNIFEVAVDKDEMWNLYLDSSLKAQTIFIGNEENTIVVAVVTLLSPLAT